jgi:hypothetical protein
MAGIGADDEEPAMVFGVCTKQLHTSTTMMSSMPSVHNVIHSPYLL